MREIKLILAGESTTTCVKVKVITAKKTLRRTFGVNLPLALRRYLALIGISVTCFGEDVNQLLNDRKQNVGFEV